MKPSIGRIVIYREPTSYSPEGRDCAAIITAVEPFGVCLTVFPPEGNPYPLGKVPHSPIVGDPAKGNWRWPERA